MAAMSKRTWYPSKAAWAEAQAKDAREGLLRVTFRSSRGWKPRAVMRNRAAEALEERARKFERLAAHFKAAGL
jgi:hypothetical protein